MTREALVGRRGTVVERRGAVSGLKPLPAKTRILHRLASRLGAFGQRPTGASGVSWRRSAAAVGVGGAVVAQRVSGTLGCGSAHRAKAPAEPVG